MAFSTRSSGSRQKSDINITPLVDVALVLLIIFLVAMPAGINHIPIAVPRAVPPPEAPPVSTPLVLLGRADGTVELDDGSGPARSVDRIDLARTIRPMVDAIRTERVVFVDFDDDLRYEDVISIMDTVKGMGRDTAGHEANPVVVALRTVGRDGAGRHRPP